jgi:DNA-binding GntR family transcriptional regulator
MSPTLESPKQLRRFVADRLRTDILEGRLQPGEWLRQERLAHMYGVSQMPVREALKELTADGLVEHLPYHGVRVVSFSLEDIEDLYAARSFLESRAARAAARHAAPEQIAALRSLVDQMKQAQAEENLPRYREINKRFHTLVATAGHRAYLERTIHQMWAAFPTMLFSNLGITASRPLSSRDNTDVAEHLEILAAIEARDERRAGDLMRRHIELVVSELIARLRQDR